MKLIFEVCQKCKGSKKLKTQLEEELATKDISAKVRYRKCMDECKKSPCLKLKKGKKEKQVWKRLDHQNLIQKLNKLS